jgi:LPXTG-motif cell wall-anchored protein
MTETSDNTKVRRMRIEGVGAILVGALLLLGVLLPVHAGATVNTIALHNDTAESGTDCPVGGGAYWHFVFAPNNGSAAFVTITLNLTSETVVFSGSQILPNGSQNDNVFVGVPSGHTLTDLMTSGSSATYTGSLPIQFNLSTVCEGTVPPTTTTTTTAPATTTTTAPATTTTTAPATTTSTAAPTTTTTAPASTTTTAGPTTTTTAPATTTTTAAPTTTSTAGPTTTSTVPGTTTTAAAVAAEVKAEDVSRTALPVTGTNAVLLGLLGLLLVLGGIVLVVVAQRRSNGEPASSQS